MQHDGNYYEYIAVYVDDLAIASKDPKGITDTLMRTTERKCNWSGGRLGRCLMSSEKLISSGVQKLAMCFLEKALCLGSLTGRAQ
jgi:hypothetical protein